MDTIFSIGSGLSAAPSYLIPFVFVILIVVFFHELGHFLVARWNGVKIEAFSVGFGPEIFGFNDRHGTRWKFSWIPLGGYVRFFGDENVASVPDDEAVARMSPEARAVSFPAKSVGQRAAVVAAGPIANFLLAIVIFATIFVTHGRIETSARVDGVAEGSAAEAAGFTVGDTVLAIDGQAIQSFTDLQRIVSASADRTITVTVQRGDAELDLVATPERQEVTDRFGNTHRIGILGLERLRQDGESIEMTRYDPATAVWLGVRETGFVITRTLTYLRDVVVGREKADQLSGPIRIAQVSGQVASIGFVALLNLAAILSVSIGLVNLFPIPMLDGGHLLYYAIEAIRGKPLSPRAQEYGFRIGLAVVLLLMVFSTWNDLSSLNVI